MINQPVRLDAVRGMRRVSGICDQIHIVTARDARRGPHVHGETTAWLKKHGWGHHKLAFEHDKITYLRERKLHYVIEDAPHTAEKAHQQGFGVFLIDHSYNRNVRTADRLWRVESFTEIPKLMEADWAKRT